MARGGASSCVAVVLLVLSLPIVAAAEPEVAIFNNGNVYGVLNGPTSPVTFSIDKPHRITSITNYHWNSARGRRAGTISLRDDRTGRVFGPWPVTTSSGQGGAPDVYWRAEPGIVLQPGSYTVIDSDPASWSQNSQSQGKGFTDIRGYVNSGGVGASVPSSKPPAGGAPIGNTIFKNGNIYGVANGPTSPTSFSIPVPMVIASITNYHWNSGRGQRGGTIALRSANGRTYGPWPVRTSAGQGGAPNVYWEAQPDELIPAGKYTVIDSDPATWSYNTQSSGQGFAEIRAIAPEPDGEPGPPPADPGGALPGQLGGREQVVDAKQATIGTAGGTIELADGASVSVKPGAVSGSSRIVFKKIGKDAVFAGTGITAYDFSADRYPSEYTLSFPVAKDVEDRYISVFNYDPREQEDEIFGSTVDFEADSVAGVVRVRARPDKIASLAPVVPIDRARFVVAQAPPVPAAPKPPVVMPFYQQDELTCYAAGLKMMERAYRPPGRDQLYDFMKALGYHERQGPSGAAYWIHKIPTQLKVATGKEVTSGAYFFTSSALNNLVTQLDKGIPVMVGRAGHSIVVAGYRKEPGQTDPSTFKWLVQDPSGDYAPNYWTNADFVTKGSTAFEVWPLEPPPAAPPQQTVGLPLSSATGWVQFYKPGVVADEGVPAPDVPLAGLGFASGKTPSGYGWKVRAKVGMEIPDEATKLSLHLPLWNTAPSSADVRVEIEVKGKAKGDTAFKETVRASLPTGAKNFVDKEIPMKALASASGPHYRLEVNLYGADGRNIDGFGVDFTYSPGFEVRAFASDGDKTAKFEVIGNVPDGASFRWSFGDGTVETTTGAKTSHTYVFEWPATGNNPFEQPEVNYKVSVEIRDSNGAVIAAPKTELNLAKGIKIQIVN